MIGTYVGVIVFFVLWAMAIAVTAQAGLGLTLGALIEPFGAGAFDGRRATGPPASATRACPRSPASCWRNRSSGSASARRSVAPHSLASAPTGKACAYGAARARAGGRRPIPPIATGRRERRPPAPRLVYCAPARRPLGAVPASSPGSTRAACCWAVAFLVMLGLRAR